MRSTDLRIGNYNLFNSKLDRINDGYDIDHVRDDKEGLHQPVPLTEEWLLLLGFVKLRIQPLTDTQEYILDKYPANHKLIARDCDDGDYSIFNHSNCNINEMQYLTKVEHVHQLQNLYHALTGKELTIQD